MGFYRPWIPDEHSLSGSREHRIRPPVWIRGKVQGRVDNGYRNKKSVQYDLVSKFLIKNKWILFALYVQRILDNKFYNYYNSKLIFLNS